MIDWLFEEFFWWVIGITVWLLFGAIATAIGYQKDRVWPCLLCGMLLGPLGMIISTMLREKGKTCPKCQTHMHRYHIYCPECGYEFPSEKPESS